VGATFFWFHKNIKNRLRGRDTALHRPYVQHLNISSAEKSE